MSEAISGCTTPPLSSRDTHRVHVRQALWLENPQEDFNTEDFPVHTQFVSVFFIDIDADVESIGKEVVDVKLPYERINFTAGGSFTATTNHMVRGMV